MQELSPTPYWPFDGSNISAEHLPKIDISDSASNQPLLHPSQAFFLARCVKSMYLSISTFYVTVDANSNLGSGKIDASNLVKRYSIPGSYISPIKFVAQPNSVASNFFIIDFSSGSFGRGTALGSIKRLGYMPTTTFKVAGGSADPSGGYLEQYISSDALSLDFQGFPSFKEGLIKSIGFRAVSSTPNYSIENVSSLGCFLRLTERIDAIYFSKQAVTVGEQVSIICPGVNPNYTSTQHRSGFSDLTELWIPGVPEPFILGDTPTNNTFLLSSQSSDINAVKDTITFTVPNKAVTGKIGFTTVAKATNPLTTSDYFTTVSPMIVN